MVNVYILWDKSWISARFSQYNYTGKKGPACIFDILNYDLINFVEKNNMDLGINIADDLEQLKNNLNKFKNSKENNCCENRVTRTDLIQS